MQSETMSNMIDVQQLQHVIGQSRHKPIKNQFVEPVCVIYGANIAVGQHRTQGVAKAPSMLRKAGLCKVLEGIGWQVIDSGDLPDTLEENQTDKTTSTASFAKNNIYYDESEIKNCEFIGKACYQISEITKKTALSKKFMLTLGGDHSIACGSIAGLLQAYPNLAIFWIDAHADANIPETSPSGNYHGMPAAHLMEWFPKVAKGFKWLSSVPRLQETSIVYIGLRDLDDTEKALLIWKGVKCFTMQHIDASSIGQVMKAALEHVDPYASRPIHLSLDIDSCDPSIAPGTGTKARGGLTYREIHYICEELAATSRLVSMDLVEIDPDQDTPCSDEVLHGDQLPIEPSTSTTVRLGIDLISSVLGKRILG